MEVSDLLALVPLTLGETALTHPVPMRLETEWGRASLDVMEKR
jgi:hypothetical protein